MTVDAIASDHLLSPQVQAAQRDELPAPLRCLHRSTNSQSASAESALGHLVLVSPGPRADCLKGVLQDCQPEQSSSGSIWCSSCPPAGMFSDFSALGQHGCGSKNY